MCGCQGRSVAPPSPRGGPRCGKAGHSLHNTIHSALYAEAARWGDYRRDVHRYKEKGQLYTVDNQYAAERNRLLTQYFPYRSENVLNQITDFVDIDDSDIMGDVNDDGTVDVADISAIITAIANGRQGTDADVNGDGIVDVADVSAVINIMANR